MEGLNLQINGIPLSRVGNKCDERRVQIFFQPQINYGILAWGNASLSTLNKTNILQKRLLRTINKVKYSTHTDPLFRKSEILKLNDLYVQYVDIHV